MEKDIRIVYTIRIRQETKKRLEILKANHPDEHWDAILKPLLTDIRLPYESLRKLNSVIEHKTPSE